MARTLTGTYLKPDGSPERGKVLLAPAVAISSSSSTVLPTPSSVRLDSSGSFSIALEATDDEAWAPDGWTWKIVEKIEGGRTFYFELPDGEYSIPSLAYVSEQDELTFIDYVDSVEVVSTEYDSIMQQGPAGEA